MAALTAEQQAFIVTRLACFESGKQVREAFREEYGIDLDKRQIQNYDATRAGKKPAEKWCQMFEETRRRFLEHVEDIPIANKAVRLQRLERLYGKTEDAKNTPLAAELLERAAKEVGGAYTNRHELTGRGGGPIETAAIALTEEERARRVADILAAAVARRNGNGNGNGVAHTNGNGNGHTNGNGRIPTP